MPKLPLNHKIPLEYQNDQFTLKNLKNALETSKILIKPLILPPKKKPLNPPKMTKIASKFLKRPNYTQNC